MYNNAYCQVYYSSSNGGQTESNAHAWGGTALPYYQIMDDPFDLKNPNSTAKKATVYSTFSSNTAAVRTLISTAAGTSDIATITGIELITPKYDSPSKLFTKAIFSFITSSGSSKACTVNLYGGLNSALGIAISSLKNEIHYVEQISGGFRVTARRYGHGVGLSQYGAQQMANDGYDYLNILGFYFKGASLVKHSFTSQVASGGTAEQSAGDAAVTASATAYVVLSDKEGRLNMRSKASDNATVVKKIPNGSKIEVMSTDAKGWIKAQFDGVTGYVVSKYVSINAPGSVSLPDPTKVADAAQPAEVEPIANPGSQLLGTGKVTMKSGNLNVRAAASSSAKVLTKIPNGASVDVYANNGGWMEVYYKGVYGYASADLIKLTGSSSTTTSSASAAASVVPVSVSAVQEGTGVIKTDSGEGNVYMRAKASASAAIRDRIPHDTVVAILKVEGSWVRISYKGNTGYVKKDFIAMN
jgi:SpoIID/LytB domain protein